VFRKAARASTPYRATRLSPLHDETATLIGYRDGSVDVRTWTAGPRPGPSALFARQNLPLIVDNGVLNPSIRKGSQWGATLGNAIGVWRSGVGVDVHGSLIYAAPNDQTAESLAEILQRADHQLIVGRRRTFHRIASLSCCNVAAAQVPGGGQFTRRSPPW
jgi:hypothetical protein